MSVSITTNPDSPRAVTDAVMIAVAGAQEHVNADGTGGQLILYLSAEKSGEKPLVSERFVPSSDGDWLWQGVTFPVSGTWAVKVRKDSDDSQVATHNVTVQST
jgi:hypothetical protein